MQVDEYKLQKIRLAPSLRRCLIFGGILRARHQPVFRFLTMDQVLIVCLAISSGV